MYNAVIVSTLLYGSETWTTNVRHLRKIEILGICRWDRVPNVDVHVRAKAQPSEVLIRGNRVRWLGHVCRMLEDRLPSSCCSVSWALEKEKEAGHIKGGKIVLRRT